MKKALFISLSLLIANNQGIILQTSVLKSLEGVWPAFDVYTILKIVHLKSQYTDMNLGKLNAKTKERTGMYTFRNQQLSIVRLAEIEKQHAGDNNTLNELQGVLSKVKADFIKLNEPFKYDPKLVSCPVLIIIGEGEYNSSTYIQEEQKECLAALPNPKSEFIITPMNEGAAHHCTTENIPLSTQVAFDWLAEIFDLED